MEKFRKGMDKILQMILKNNKRIAQVTAIFLLFTAGELNIPAIVLRLLKV